MRKWNYLLAITIFCMALVSSQGMMAKKVINGAYQHSGEVNKETALQDNDQRIDLSKCYYKSNEEFGILYPNGNILYKDNNSSEVYITIDDKDCYFVYYPDEDMKIDEVFKGERQLPYISSTDRGVTDPNWSSFRIGVRKTGEITEDEINKIIKESVLPMFEIKKSSTPLVFRYCSRSSYTYHNTDGSGSFISMYVNGEFQTNEDIAKADAKKEAAIRLVLNKEYGNSFVDALGNGKLLVGMPYKLLINKQMNSIRPGISVYKMYVYNNGESGQYKVKIAEIGKTYNGWGSDSGIYYKTYRIWVKNWKITQFREWTNADEILYNSL